MMIGSESGVMSGKIQAVKMERYYRFHAHLYDLTRWSFLFGRQRIIHLAAECVQPRNILEIGCGTGANLDYMADLFPGAMITGVDISGSMLAKARRRLENYGPRIELMKYNYCRPLLNGGYDLILFSYTLTMIDPGWRDALAAASHDLSPDGCIAVVDFHSTRLKPFREWMGFNHVRMEGQLMPWLTQHFEPFSCNVDAAYGGIWDYLCFVGGPRKTF